MGTVVTLNEFRQLRAAVVRPTEETPFDALFRNARTASATAVYVLPVPAGPSAKTIS